VPHSKAFLACFVLDHRSVLVQKMIDDSNYGLDSSSEAAQSSGSLPVAMFGLDLAVQNPDSDCPRIGW
jgi:hypothetical protein